MYVGSMVGESCEGGGGGEVGLLARNLLDPESEVSKVLARKNVFRLKAEMNTFPKFFYFYD